MGKTLSKFRWPSGGSFAKALAAAACALTLAANADECRWTGGDGDWGEPSNWSGGTVPRAGQDDVVFANAQPIVVTYGSHSYAKSLSFVGADVTVTNVADANLYLDATASVADGVTAKVFNCRGRNNSAFSKIGAGAFAVAGGVSGFSAFEVAEGEVTLCTTPDGFYPCAFVDVAAGARVRHVNANCVQNQVVFRLAKGADFVAQESDQLGAVVGEGRCYSLAAPTSNWRPNLNFELDASRGPYETRVAYSNVVVLLLGAKPDASDEDKAKRTLTVMDGDSFKFAGLETRSGYLSSLRFAAGVRDFQFASVKFCSEDAAKLVDAMGEPVRVHAAWVGSSSSPVEGDGVFDFVNAPGCFSSYWGEANRLCSDSFDGFCGDLWLNASTVTFGNVQYPEAADRLAGVSAVRKIKRLPGCTYVSFSTKFPATVARQMDLAGAQLYSTTAGGSVAFPALYEWKMGASRPYGGDGFVFSGDSHVEHSTDNNWMHGNWARIRLEDCAYARFAGGINACYNLDYKEHSVEIADDSTLALGGDGVWNVASASDRKPTRVRFLGGTLAYVGDSDKSFTAAKYVGFYPNHQYTVTNRPAKIKVDTSRNSYGRTLGFKLYPAVGEGEIDGGLEKSGLGNLRFTENLAELQGPVAVKAGLLVSGSSSAGAPFGSGDVSLAGASAAIDGGKGVAKTLSPNGALTYSGASELRVVGKPGAGDGIVVGKSGDEPSFVADGASAFLTLRGENVGSLPGADWTAKANGAVATYADGRVKAAIVAAAPTANSARGKFSFLRYAAETGFSEFSPKAFDAAGAEDAAFLDAAATLDDDKQVAALDVRNVTLDLGGHKLTVGDDVNPALVLANASADLYVVKNGTLDFGASRGFLLAAGADKWYRVTAKCSGSNGLAYGGLGDSPVTFWVEQGGHDYAGGTWIEGVRVLSRVATPFGAEGAEVNVVGNEAWGGTFHVNDSSTEVTRPYAWRFSGWGTFTGSIRQGAVCAERAAGATLRGTAEIVDEAMFRVADGRTLTMAATVSGAGRIVKAGCGTLEFTAGSNLGWSGGLRVSEGEVKVSSAAQLGTGDVYVEAAGKLVFVNDEDETVSVRVYGPGEIQLLGKGKVTFTNDVGFKGKKFTAAGGVFETDGTDVDSAYFAGSISGSGVSYVKRGDGVQILAGTNTFGGSTTVAAGTLVLGGVGYAEEIADSAFCRLDASAAGTVLFRQGTSTDEVETWRDVKGRYEFKQAYDSAHPDWEYAVRRTGESGMNGLDTVFFTGYKNRLQATANVPGFRTLVIAHRASSGSHPKSWTCAGVYGYPGADNGIRVSGGNDSVAWSAEHGYYYVNGEQTLSVPCAAALVSTVISPEVYCNNTKAVLGDYWGHSTNNRCWWGDVGEVLLFDYALDPAQRLVLENALMEKWGAKEPSAAVAENVLPAGTDLEVFCGAKVRLAEVNQTVASISGGGEIANDGDGEVVLTITGSESDFFGTISGKVVLNFARGSVFDLGGRTLRVWGAAGTGRVTNGTLVVYGEDRRQPLGTAVIIR